MLCFAANSLLCRLALAPKLIDPATFTSVRVLSAATMLSIVVWLRRRFADEGVRLTRPQIERHALQRVHAGVGLGDRSRVEEQAGHGQERARRRTAAGASR
jgi:drug/metabolite transporter (DMT)-like permease